MRSEPVHKDDLNPRILVLGVGGAGGNAVNNMIGAGLRGVTFVAANTDNQALAASRADIKIQLGLQVTEGLGAGSSPQIGQAAAEESFAIIRDSLAGAHMAFVTAGMGGGTGTGAAPVIARAAREAGVFTVGVVTKPFEFEGERRMAAAEAGISALEGVVDTLIVIPNQNLFKVADETTLITDAFALADQVLHGGVACITDLMVNEGLINLDFADVKMVMSEGGTAIMGSGQAKGPDRGLNAAEIAISNRLLDDHSLSGAKGLLISITGDRNLTLNDVESAVMRIRKDVSRDAIVIVGATFDDTLTDGIRVSVVATGQEITAHAFTQTAAPELGFGLAADAPANGSGAEQMSVPFDDVRPGHSDAQTTQHLGAQQEAQSGELSNPHDGRRPKIVPAEFDPMLTVLRGGSVPAGDHMRPELAALTAPAGGPRPMSETEKTGLFKRVATQLSAQSTGAKPSDSQLMDDAPVAQKAHTAGHVPIEADDLLTNGYPNLNAPSSPAMAPQNPAIAGNVLGGVAESEGEVLELPSFLRK